MVGTILSNFWAALFAFSIYFFSTYPFIHAQSILFNASMIAIIVFLLTFLARAVIAFVMENPVIAEQEILLEVHTEESDQSTESPSSEKYAEIVKSMLNEDE
jgi:hypothetical protein